MIRLAGLLKLWSGERGSWHFFTVPEDQADPIRAHRFEGPQRGFGSVRVEARIGAVAWRTSLFEQKSGGFILPVKAAVRRNAGISAGDEITVELELL
jgi:Domain of unknown function (DUF1905)